MTGLPSQADLYDDPHLDRFYRVLSECTYTTGTVGIAHLVECLTENPGAILMQV